MADTTSTDKPKQARGSTPSKTDWIYWLVLAATGAGLVDAAYLSSLHFSVDKACGSGNGCSAVLTSPWATIGGIPVAALGMGMYLAMAWFVVQILQSSEKRSEHTVWLLAISSAGVAVSAVFIAVQAFVIGQWCPFCLLSAALTTTSFLLTVAACRVSGCLAQVRAHPSVLWRDVPAAGIAFLLPILLLFASGWLLERAPGKEKYPGSNPVVGTIGDRQYRLDQVDQAISVQLQQLERQRYNIRKSYLETELIRREAAERGISADDLYKKEVLGAIHIGRDELKQYMDKNHPDAGRKEQAELLPKIVRALQKEKLPDVQKKFIDKLMAKHGATFAIPLPELLSIEANPRGGPIVGPEDAAVTIVAFSDFECPYCSKAHAELAALMKRYPTDIRMAFRHFPLQQHKHALRAAEMAACVQKQNRFWPYADLLFENQKDLSEERLADFARQVDVDMDELAACLESGAGKKTVAEDMAEGRSIGVQSTPSLFINGRFFLGLPNDLDKIIDEERARSSSGGP